MSDTTSTPPAAEAPPSIGTLGNPPASASTPPAPLPQAQSFAELLDDKGGFKQGWTQALPEHLKPFEGTFAKYPNPFEALAGLGNANKKLSERQVSGPPPEGSTPEVIEAYNAKVRQITGAPDKPEGYGLAKPENLPAGMEWNQGFADKVTAIAHKHAASPVLLKELAAAHNENIAELIGKSQKAQEDQTQAAIAELNKEWGGDAPVRWQEAKRGIAILGGDPNADSYSVQDIMRMALNADKAFREDNGLVGGGDAVKQTLAERKRALETDPAWLNPKTTQDQRRNDEIGAELMRIHEAMKRV